jgi:malate dehydrogenase (oxaloacetate-decarboxylating)(NADP+)
VLQAHKLPYARDDITEQLTSLEAVVKAIKPSGLIGLAGAGRAFTEPILREMAKNNERPLIMALSNPTSKSECTAQEVRVET